MFKIQAQLIPKQEKNPSTIRGKLQEFLNGTSKN
jgi:hypothetical protein